MDATSITVFYDSFGVLDTDWGDVLCWDVAGYEKPGHACVIPMSIMDIEVGERAYRWLSGEVLTDALAEDEDLVRERVEAIKWLAVMRALRKRPGKEAPDDDQDRDDV